MIRCTIEILPGGDESRARKIGLIEIADDGTGTEEIGHYVVVLTKTPPFSGALKQAWRKKRFLPEYEDDKIMAGEVEGHHRVHRGSYDLLYRALRACGMDKRNR